MAKKLYTFLTKEIGEVCAMLVSVVLLFVVFSCEPHVQSLNDPLRKVTRLEIRAELDYYMSLAAARFAQLDRQEAFQRILFENAVLFSESGTLNIQGLISMVFAVLGVGAITDNVHKRLDIKKLNNANKA